MIAFLTIAFLHFIAVIVPGPDFAMVSKNAIIYSKKSAIYTALGIALGLCVHITYCILGLAIVISQSLFLFNIIKYLGAAYLIFIGIQSLSYKSSLATDALPLHAKQDLTTWQALRQGILCNVLNPKATLFMLGLFTIVVKPQTPVYIQIAYGIEMFLMTFVWFTLVATLLNHKNIKQKLLRFQQTLSHMMGGFFLFFGVKLILLRQ